MDLHGAVIVITGANRGLGKALCSQLRSAGATVVGITLREHPEQDTVQLDVANGDAMQSCIDTIVEKHGKVDVLINNAGAVGELQPIEDVSDADCTKQLETNVRGVFNGIRSVLPIMKRNASGCIITISSRAARRAHPLLALYSATKAAATSLTQAVARQVHEAELPIRCLILSPGGIDTDMRSTLFGKEDSAKQQSPDQVAQCVLNILQEKVSMPNGTDASIINGEICDVIPLQ